MVAAVDRLPTAEMFAMNLSELTQPKVEEPSVAVNLRNAFEGVTLTGKVDGPAANTNAAPNALAAAAALAGGASVMPAEQKQSLASGAVLTGQSLQSVEGCQIDSKASGPLEFASQGAKLAMQVGEKALETAGQAFTGIMSVFSLGDRNSDGIPDSQQNLAEMEEPKMRPAYTAKMNSMPSPSGMG